VARSINPRTAVERAELEAEHYLNLLWGSVEAQGLLADDRIEIARLSVTMALDAAARRFSEHELNRIAVIKAILALVLKDLDAREERASGRKLTGPLACSY